MRKIYEPSENWDKEEKIKTDVLAAYQTGISLMETSGLLGVLKSKHKEMPSYGNNFLVGILAFGFYEYSQQSLEKRKSYENAVKKFLSEFKLDKDSEVVRTLKSTFNLIDSKRR